MTESVSTLLETLRDVVLKDEDGNTLSLVLREPATERAILDREKSIGTTLPMQLKELLSISNGIGLFGVELMPLSELYYFTEQSIVQFHPWGNGDFDCITTRGCEEGEGRVVFMNHSPHVLSLIELSLASWMRRVVAEVTKKHVLLHPADYRVRDDMGLYGNVLNDLRGVPCELNS
jgi:hypothetical protein